MTIPTRLQHYLDDHHCHYQVVHHPRSRSSMETARTAHVSADCLAKSVVLEDDDGYLMTVLPATRRVDLQALYDLTGRRLRLAREDELQPLFADCDPGAVPAVAGAYGMEAIIDESIAEAPEVWFEAGDHRDVIHMDGGEFRALMPGARRGTFTRPML
jgi:Ala-tRNA(Pro) deacylase